MLTSGIKDPVDLKNKINAELAKNKGIFAVAYRNLASGEEILINEKINFHAASTMKTPVLIEAYKQANAGNFSINDSLTVKNEFRSIVDGSAYSLDPKDDSETELYTKAGRKVKIYDLLYLMASKSSFSMFTLISCKLELLTICSDKAYKLKTPICIFSSILKAEVTSPAILGIIFTLSALENFLKVKFSSFELNIEQLFCC